MVSRTGFWVDAENTRVLWARDNGSDKRSELWELAVTADSYEWRDVSAEFKPYGFAGYMGVLQYRGYVCVQQPNGFTKNVVELPKLPYPSGLLSGTTVGDGAWQYVPAQTVEPGADTPGYSVPGYWTCPKTACTDSVDDLPDMLPDDSVPDGGVWDDMEPTPEETAEYYAMLADDYAPTEEFPEVPPTANSDATVIVVVESVIPAGVAVKDMAALSGYKRKNIRYFRDGAGRKLAYVGHDDTSCAVVWRDWYAHDDTALDAEVADYVRSLGYRLAA